MECKSYSESLYRALFPSTHCVEGNSYSVSRTNVLENLTLANTVARVVTASFSIIEIGAVVLAREVNKLLGRDIVAMNEQVQSALNILYISLGIENEPNQLEKNSYHTLKHIKDKALSFANSHKVEIAIVMGVSAILLGLYIASRPAPLPTTDPSSTTSLISGLTSNGNCPPPINGIVSVSKPFLTDEKILLIDSPPSTSEMPPLVDAFHSFDVTTQASGTSSVCESFSADGASSFTDTAEFQPHLDGKESLDTMPIQNSIIGSSLGTIASENIPLPATLVSCFACIFLGINVYGITTLLKKVEQIKNASEQGYQNSVKEFRNEILRSQEDNKLLSKSNEKIIQELQKQLQQDLLNQETLKNEFKKQIEKIGEDQVLKNSSFQEQYSEIRKTTEEILQSIKQVQENNKLPSESNEKTIQELQKQLQQLLENQKSSEKTLEKQEEMEKILSFLKEYTEQFTNTLKCFNIEQKTVTILYNTELGEKMSKVFRIHKELKKNQKFIKNLLQKIETESRLKDKIISDQQPKLDDPALAEEQKKEKIEEDYLNELEEYFADQEILKALN